MTDRDEKRPGYGADNDVGLLSFVMMLDCLPVEMLDACA